MDFSTRCRVHTGPRETGAELGQSPDNRDYRLNYGHALAGRESGSRTGLELRRAVVGHNRIFLYDPTSGAEFRR